ncbi:unnamed protein product, partial [Brachionus calyciflorus]
ESNYVSTNISSPNFSNQNCDLAISSNTGPLSNIQPSFQNQNMIINDTINNHSIQNKDINNKESKKYNDAPKSFKFTTVTNNHGSRERGNSRRYPSINNRSRSRSRSRSQFRQNKTNESSRKSPYFKQSHHLQSKNLSCQESYYRPKQFRLNKYSQNHNNLYNKWSDSTFKNSDNRNNRFYSILTV